MTQSSIGQRGCDMFANTRGDKCANRWGVVDSCGTDQHLSDITSELTRGANQSTLRRTKKVAKHAPAARVQRFVRWRTHVENKTFLLARRSDGNKRCGSGLGIRI